MPRIFTIDEARKILQVDQDFDEEMIELYLDIAEGQILEQTGYDFTSEPNADCRDYVRKSILMQHYNPDGYNKEYDFVFGMHADITRLSALAKRKRQQEQGDS